jgi:RNA polymerase sigma-70 factor, ECF subfamily
MSNLTSIRDHARLSERPMQMDGDKVQNPDHTLESAPPGSRFSGHDSSGECKSANTKTDEQLLESARSGDVACFRVLVERYHRELFHFLVHFLGDRTAAEDTFQETFLQVYESAAHFDISRRFRPWLFTIAANKARDLLRSQARRPTEPMQALLHPDQEDSGAFVDLLKSPGPQPHEALEAAELRQRVRQTVTSMPDMLREILLLSYFHQFPYRQISDILGIPLGTVKSRLHAAVADFAQRWKLANQNRRHA